MTEPWWQPEPERQEPPAKDKEAWKLVYFGQISRDLVPPHPEPSETPEDELTQAALSDPDGPTRGEQPSGAPTLWRVVTLLALAVTALALVFWRTH
jgi:hypothetical protein